MSKTNEDLFGSDSDSDGDLRDNSTLRISQDDDAEKSGSDQEVGSPTAENPEGTPKSDHSDADDEHPDQETDDHTETLTRESDSDDHVKAETITSPVPDEEIPLIDAVTTEEPTEGEGALEEMEIPRWEPDFGGRFVYWKMQDLLRAESRPFDAEGYDDDFEDYEDEPPAEVQDLIRQKIKSTMRWRYITLPDGTRVPESNTKLVKWSDGSSSIVIGDEYFDISYIPLKGEYHQMFIRQGASLQGGVIFKEKMTLRPAMATASSARKSRSMAAARPSGSGMRIDPKDGLKQQVVYLGSFGNKDPEKHRAQLMREEDERLKASIKRETQQRRVRERVFSRGINSNFLEGNEEEGDNSISIAAIKNKFKRGDFTHPVYSDEDESDEGSRWKKLETAKDLDDDDDFGVKKKKTEEGTVKKRVAVIDDDDED